MGLTQDSSTTGVAEKDLEALKPLVQDAAYPTLDLGRALNSYEQAFSLSRRELVEKLNAKEKFSWITKAMSLAKFEAEYLTSWEGRRLSEREIDKALEDLKKANIQPKLRQTDDKQGDPSVNQGLIDVKQRQTDVNLGEAPVNQGQIYVNQRQTDVNQRQTDVNQAQERENLRFPLLSDTINELTRLIFFWVREPNLGQVAERWAIKLAQIGWLWVGLGAVCVGLVMSGVLHLPQDVKQLVSAWRPALVVGNTEPGSNAAIPAPRRTVSRWVAGHRLEFRWTSAGPGYRYRLYRHTLDGESIRPLTTGDSEVKSPGAIVAVSKLWGKSQISVTAINAQDEESAHSERIEFEPNAMNDQDLLEPLPEEGITPDAGTRGRGDLPAGRQARPTDISLPASPRRRVAVSPSLLPPPTQVHFYIQTPDLIRLTWRSVAPDATYNVYSSAVSTLTALRKENERPLKSNIVDWTPETGLDRYWIVVTTLDKAGNESAYSEAIEVVRRPEKSTEDLDAAAKTLKKVLNW